MDLTEYNDVVVFLLDGKTPGSMAGTINKYKRKDFKRKCINYRLVESAREIFRDGKRCLLKITKSFERPRVVLRVCDLEEVWQHFHVDPKTGGHAGIHAMELMILREYYMPSLRKWLTEMKRSCHTCKQTVIPVVPPPTAAELPKTPCVMWQMDYIGPFPPDSNTGARYGFIVIDCH